MLIDDFNQIIEDEVDKIQQKFKVDFKKDVDTDIYYHMNLFFKLKNFKHRAVYGKSYYVVCSKELKEHLSKIPNEFIRNFHTILEIIGSNGNLIPYQSKYIESPSLDILFNNYKINHLHLSSKKENNTNFMKRADYLLFFTIYGDMFFLIDIDKHPKDYKWIEKYPEIVYDNWPFIYDKSMGLKDVTDFNPKYNREEEYELSKYVSLLKNIRGNIYLPAFWGIGSNGVPTQYIWEYDHLINRLGKLENALTNEDTIKKLGFSCSKDCKFKLKFKNNKLILFEQKRNEYYDLKFYDLKFSEIF